MNKKYGFTLSEMLIVISIIGVIAALTIPALQQSTARREYVSSVKKSYSITTQAVSVMESKYGPIKFWPWSNVDKINEMFSQHLSISANCGTGPGCFTNTMVKYLNNSPDKNYYSDTTGIKYKLADGQGLMIIPGTFSQNSSGNDNSKSRAKFIVDVNGEQGPNQWGRDFFAFYVDEEDGVLPAGTNNETLFEDENDESGSSGGATENDPSKNCTSGGDGTLCAAKVIAEGKMDY